ncbi:hypothetical protein NPIL_115981 [Nephila pilipes]|uniref:Uncharacterized protein n=1 Tax=Nephila pilipes TaxID=299642 RepID=A0A8X6R1I5_NEPPI|nr:hypothetical protein NPIL_115981 [Nephila pilipes]
MWLVALKIRKDRVGYAEAEESWIWAYSAMHQRVNLSTSKVSPRLSRNPVQFSRERRANALKTNDYRMQLKMKLRLRIEFV